MWHFLLFIARHGLGRVAAQEIAKCPLRPASYYIYPNTALSRPQSAFSRQRSVLLLCTLSQDHYKSRNL
jgi:hypothetical protein